MYDNNTFNFNDDGTAEIFRIGSEGQKEVLARVSVRENNDLQQDASFAGGVANLGVNYVVETSDFIDKSKIKPYACQVLINGIEYKLLSMPQHFSKLGGLNNYKQKQLDTVLFLG